MPSPINPGFLTPHGAKTLRDLTDQVYGHDRDLQRRREQWVDWFPAQLTAGPFKHGDPLPGAPVVLFATVTSSGNQITLEFSEPVTGTTGFTLTASGGAVTLTYVSGSGTTTYVFSTSRPIAPSETVTLAYSPGNVADTTSTALAAFSGRSVTNNGSAPPAVVTAGGRYSWKQRAFDRNGVRYDPAGQMQGTPLWMPAYVPSDQTMTVPAEVWLRRKVDTDSLRGPEYEVLGGGSSADVIQVCLTDKDYTTKAPFITYSAIRVTGDGTTGYVPDTSWRLGPNQQAPLYHLRNLDLPVMKQPATGPAVVHELSVVWVRKGAGNWYQFDIEPWEDLFRLTGFSDAGGAIAFLWYYDQNTGTWKDGREVRIVNPGP